MRCRRVRTYRIHAAWVALAAASVLAAATIGWMADRLDGYVSETRRYSAAESCPAGEHARRDCLRVVSAVVVAVVDVDGDNPRHSLVLRGDGQTLSDRGVPVNGAGPMIDLVEAGDTVQATVWNGRVMELRAEGRSERTRETPHDGASAAITALGVLVPVTALLSRWAWWVRRHTAVLVDDPRDTWVGVWDPIAAGLAAAAVAVMLVGVFGAWLGLFTGLTGQVVVTVVGAVLGLCGGAMTGRPRRSRPR